MCMFQKETKRKQIVEILNKKINTNMYPHLIINGTTGSGKTSLVKKIIADNLTEYKICYFSPKKYQLREFKYSINIIDTENELLQTIDYIDKAKSSNCLLIIDELIYSMVIYKWLYNRLLKIAVIGRENNNQLILITQRASYKFFSGELKANINNLITLRTLNKSDSRMILGDIRAINLKQGEYILKQGETTYKGIFNNKISFIPNNNQKILKKFKSYLNYDKEKILYGNNGSY